MRTMRNALMTMLALAAGTAHAASGGVPLAISHTGYFLDGSDLPVNSPGLALKFEIYDVDLPIGGQQLQWEATCTVPVSHGYYAVVLGEAPCAGTSQLDSADLPSSQSRWLQLSVDGIALTPRLQLTAAPSAAVATLALDSQKLGGIAATALVDGTGKVLVSALPTGAGGVLLLDAGGQMAAGVLPTGGITNAHVAAGAGIAASKIAGLGSLAGKNSIDDADVAAGAGIAASKIAGLGSLAAKNGIDDADVAAGAGIAVSKLAAGTNGQILTTSGGAPAWSTVSGTLGYTPVNAAGDTMTGGLNLPANGLAVGGSQLVVNSGNVGIGTANPDAPLAVNGATRLNGTFSNNYTFPNATSWSAADFRANVGDPATTFHNQNIALTSTNPLAERQGGSLALGGTRDALGNGMYWSLIKSYKTNATEDDHRGELALFTNGGAGFVERMRLDSSGNVGIGTADPGAPLEVRATRTASTDTDALIISDNVTGAQTDGVGTYIKYKSNTGNAVASIGFLNTDGTNNNTSIAFKTSASAGSSNLERMRIGPNGNVGIGTTSPFQNTTVNGAGVTAAGSTGGGYQFGIQSAGVTSLTLGSDINNAYLQSWQNKPLHINNQGNNTILNFGGGNVGIGTTSPGAKLEVANGAIRQTYSGSGSCTTTHQLVVASPSSILNIDIPVTDYYQISMDITMYGSAGSGNVSGSYLVGGFLCAVSDIVNRGTPTTGSGSITVSTCPSSQPLVRFAIQNTEASNPKGGIVRYTVCD